MMGNSYMVYVWLIICVVALTGLASGPCRAIGDAVTYGVGSWPREMGDMRARVRVNVGAEAVVAHVGWRRHDPAPQEKAVVVVDAATGKEIANVARLRIGPESGDIAFAPETVPGDYYLYYMPYKVIKAEQWQYTIEYLQPTPPADADWSARNSLRADDLAGGAWESLPKADLIEIQARTEFDRPDPMEVIATRAETDELLKRFPLKPYLLFPEDRRYPIRMTDCLPLRWIETGPGDRFEGEAARGEFYTFQIGLYAARMAVDDVQVGFSDMRCESGSQIPADGFTCFNLMGTDCLGLPMQKSVKVALGRVQALWFGLQIPKQTPPGVYRETLALKVAGAQQSIVKLSLRVTDQTLDDAGDSELWRMSRLRWLNSTTGIDDTVTAPYTPLQSSANGVKCLGREIRFAATGLPSSIKSGQREILARPIEFVAETANGSVKWKASSTARTLDDTAARLVRESSAHSDLLSLDCVSKTDFDGYTNFRLMLEARRDSDLKDIRLEIPVRKDVAIYMMGLGRKGGCRPDRWQWTWDVRRANNMVWIGDVDAGLQCKLKANTESWDIYDLSESGLPDSWANGGKGGCDVVEDGDAVLVRAYSGPRSIKAGDKIEFRFGLLVTPVKPLDPAHWSQRYYHQYVPVQTAKDAGATIINIHQGNELNPYINYPFLTVDKLAAYVKSAHEQGMKVKIYYTVRELSNHVAEMWALRSLGSEVFCDGPGGGDPWLREHLVSGYQPAWREKLSESESDAAIKQTGLSRWHNYYLEGLAWLMRNVGIDGLYLDGIGYDREVMKRVRRTMDQVRPGSLIDFHSGNEFDFHDLRISPACKYMEHFPYIDSLWFGEGYEYETEPPDYWLVEISGIPFGLYGEMLHGNGNPWRGMIYGMTARYYSGADPKHIWRLWDDFGIADAKMIGYWDRSCPVKTDNKDVLATVYAKSDKALISLASWAKDPVKVKLDIDWAALGLDSRKATLTAPAIPGFQDAMTAPWSGEIAVEPGKGWLLVLAEE